MRIFKNKICVLCDSMYTPAGGGQTMCEKCGAEPWHSRHNEESRKRDRARYAANTAKRRRSNRESIFGKGASQHFSDQLAEQNNVCASCGEQFKGTRDAHSDHNHLTGQWRGVLCLGCNLGIGNFKESTDKLLKAVQYLLKWRSGS